jgi:hypothetical protein
MLSLEGERLNSVREAVTTQDGTFRLEDLDPGVWTIYPRPLGPGCSAAKQARVGRGEDFEVEIVADPPRRLFGRLTRHGEPAPQYYLILTSASDSNLSSSASRLERIQVQADGRYEYPVVVPGEYDLIAARNNPWEVLTRRLTVRSDQDTELDWDVGEKLLRMVFTRHGAPADDVEGGYIYTRGISTDLHEIPGQPGIWCASLDDGPALALLWSRQDNSDPVTRTTVRGEDLFEVAYCAGACRGTEPVSFDVHGSSVVVRCTTPTVTRPRAYLVAVDEFREIWGVRQWPSLAWRDDGDDRRFDDLPAGSRVTIVGPRLEGLGNYRVTVDVSAMAESVITWPPGP